MANPIHFIKDVKNELTKVIWPSRQQTIKMTLYVIAISLFVAVILGAIDYGLSEVLERFVL
ncbi:MAG: preprotein translocase subunit SecE [Candidatus Doudnabacteria bacterium RIFCSPHIGHO2_02_FULL_46_11]|uniref:Protein translocase subunit SecE n=1 Tax=Candidatus Doudnabacteria bacterium RIFCSPHIGHO2_02_FULL_46_11 TaxID=1817832 RepID=A0A1F5P9N1_9BACT|nr:MAG: preprotein translocase subunit SecE [Candidatus Doudnabacteria bacterium RIFCSPHIGHO2_02_FULL_46_11]